MIDIIPAIDIIDGKCVRLSKGEYDSQIIYNENPLEVALEFEDNGIKRLHMVDLDGAKSQHVVNYKVLDRIASRTSLTIDFGGGIKSDKDLEIAFDHGASMLTIGSIAAKNPELFLTWLTRYGNSKIILGADVKEDKVVINGWQEESLYTLVELLDEKVGQGVSQVLCTDVSKDGMLGGVSVELYQNVMKKYPNLYLIASGGISSIDDLHELNELNIPAVVLGKALYERKIKLSDLKEFIL